MRKPIPGDKVLLDSAKGLYHGILMPSPELGGKDLVILKLQNGYNIGFKKQHINKIKLIKKYREKKKKKKKMQEKKGLPVISILHTGGTIASKVDYETGGVVARFSPEEIVNQFPELNKLANIRSRLMRNMSSDDMRFEHYNLMAEEVKEEIDAGAEGVIITHGTDTLHYSAAALSFILDGLHSPVLLVGAQRSSDRGSSDAAMNLLCAAKFIAKADFGEIGICMHAGMSDDYCHILPGLKTRKMHTSRRDAFKAINDKPWARVAYEKEDIVLLKKGHRKKKKAPITLKLMDPKLKVGILKAHPHMRAEEVLLYKDFAGLVLEGTGLGHMPISEIDEFTKEHTKIYNAIKKLIKNGVVVVMAPQTIYGSINMQVYAPGRTLHSAGILGNYLDMSPETAFIKLAWLLSNYTKEETKKLYSENLLGEINNRLTPDMFFQ